MLGPVWLLTAALAAAPAAGPEAGVPVLWRAAGGELRLRLNDDLLALYGVAFRLPKTPVDSREPAFALFPIADRGGLDLEVTSAGIAAIRGGAATALGSLRIIPRSGTSLAVAPLSLRARPPDGLELVDARGRPLLEVAQLMLGIEEERRFRVHTADLIVTAELAARLAAPALAGKTVGELRLAMPIVEGPGEQPLIAKCADPNFHGEPHPAGGSYRTDVFLDSLTWHVMRCRNAGGGPCDGPGGDDGEVVFAPGAALRNGDDERTADVPWVRKFTVSPWNYPYPGNDQHPYLVWNLYRIRDGRLEQIGASGVKHAFYTINWYCAPGACGAGGGQILGRACYDIYSQSSNDHGPDLGPRRELVPFTGQWGRCGSIFDPGCTGSQTHPSPNGPYDHRLRVRESALGIAGAQYFAEAWYVIQDDVDIWNTMGHREVAIAFDGFSWTPTATSPMQLGPVIDRWVDPVAHPARNLTLSGPQGRVKIAVRATPLSSCPPDSALSPPCWRFDYALLNADFAAVETSGSPPNLRVVAHRGLGELLLGFDPALPLHVPADAFSDLDQDPGNDWSATRDAAGLRFRAPPGQGLRWGTLYRFSVIADRPLDDDSRHPVALRDELDAPVLAGLLAGPREPSLLFRDGFE